MQCASTLYLDVIVANDTIPCPSGFFCGASGRAGGVSLDIVGSAKYMNGVPAELMLFNLLIRWNWASFCGVKHDSLTPVPARSMPQQQSVGVDGDDASAGRYK